MTFIYHIRPRFLAPGMNAALVDLRVEALGIHLAAAELATGRPYRNKWWKVGRLKIGRKAVDGILIILPDFPPDIEVCARWEFGDECVGVHKVTYKLLDRDFRAASDDMTKWNATVGYAGRPRFENRRPNPAAGKLAPPVDVMPRMDTSFRDGDEFHEGWRVLVRRETFELPTIEPERIIGDSYPRENWSPPSLDMAINLAGGDLPRTATP